MKLNVTIPIEQYKQLNDQSEMLREAATYEHAGCTASAMGWAIKYANIHERMEAAATEIERLREALREIRSISNGCEDSWDMLAKIEAAADEVLTANAAHARANLKRS